MNDRRDYICAACLAGDCAVDLDACADRQRCTCCGDG